MIGNPGQAAYVAANGYLQGLMRRRRGRGLCRVLPSPGAPSPMSRAGPRCRGCREVGTDQWYRGDAGPRCVVAPGGIAGTRRCLPAHRLLRDVPAGRGLARVEAVGDAGLQPDFATVDGTDSESIVDLAAQIAGKSEIEARATVAALVAQEVARILRLSAEDIDVTRPLDELGMDSLMSLNCGWGSKADLGLSSPSSPSVPELTLTTLPCG